MNMLVNIDVPDLARATDFYCAAFELKVGRRLGSGVVELLGGAAPIYLLLKEAGSSPSGFTQQTRRYERHWCPLHLDIVVTDIESAITRATRAGATQERPMETAEWGKIAMFSDPFGHGFCLLEFVGPGYDAIANVE